MGRDYGLCTPDLIYRTYMYVRAAMPPLPPRFLPLFPCFLCRFFRCISIPPLRGGRHCPEGETSCFFSIEPSLHRDVVCLRGPQSGAASSSSVRGDRAEQSPPAGHRWTPTPTRVGREALAPERVCVECVGEDNQPCAPAPIVSRGRRRRRQMRVCDSRALFHGRERREPGGLFDFLGYDTFPRIHGGHRGLTSSSRTSHGTADGCIALLCIRPVRRDVP